MKPGTYERIEQPIRPTISYCQAMCAFLIAKNGEVLEVVSCSAAQFAEVVLDALATLPETTKHQCLHKRRVRHDLKHLDYREMLARWYALEALQSAGAAVNLHTENSKNNGFHAKIRENPFK